MDGISVIIPTYNERESITGLLAEITREVRPLSEVIVIDDDSPDRTWQAVEEAARSDPRIRCIRRLTVRGLATAVRDGIAAARGSHVLWFDADFRSDPGSLAALCAAKDTADIVVASRYAGGGGDARIEPFRVFSSRIFNRFARAVLATRCRDLTSGHCICRRGVFSALRLRGDYGDYFVRFISQAERSGLSVSELPMRIYSRSKGESKTTAGVFGFVRKGFIYFLTAVSERVSRT